MLESLKWESLEQRRLKARATMAFKIKENLVALPRDPFFVPRSAEYEMRLQRVLLPEYLARQDYLMYSFFYNAPAIWNSLPAEVTNSNSLEDLKSGLVGVTLPLQKR